MDATLARMKMEMADPEVLRQQVAAVMSANGLTQEKAGKEIGVSASALNQWLSSKYKGDNEALNDKLIIWLSSRDRKGATPVGLLEDEYMETETSAKVMSALGFCQATADLTVIFGGAGLCKTITSKYYATVNPNVWVVTMRPDTSGVTPAIEEITVKMGLPLEGRANKQSRAISSKLEGTGGLLIIDEAQHLDVQAIEAIRSIYDAAREQDRGVGLAFCGNEAIYARLTGGTRAANYAQLFSRIGKRVHLTKATKQDVVKLASRFGIEEGVELTTLIALSQKPGALRGMVKVLRQAYLFAGGEAITNKHIIAAYKDLGGEV